MAQWLVQWNLLGIFALCSKSHSASPLLEGTGYGIRGYGRGSLNGYAFDTFFFLTLVPNALEPFKSPHQGP